MTLERRHFRCCNNGALRLICLTTFCLLTGYVFNSADVFANQNDRYRVFSLKHITAQQGKEYLSQSSPATVSILPSPNTILVTAEQLELLKASIILKLVDSDSLYTIERLLPVADANNFPSNERIQAEIKKSSIVTFQQHPIENVEIKAVIDTYDNWVLIIADSEHISEIKAVIERLRAADIEKAAADVNDANDSAKPADPNKSIEPKKQEDELFQNLIESMKKAEYQAEQPAEPNEKIQLTEEQLSQAEPEDIKTPAEQKTQEDQLEPKAKPEKKIESESEPATEETADSEDKIRSYAPDQTNVGDEMLELDLPEKLNIIDLLSLVGEYLHLDYMYDEADVEGSVSLRLQGPIKVKDLYPLMESILKFRDLVMTRKDNLVTIVKKDKVMSIDPVLHTDASKLQLGEVIITRVFELKHISSSSAQNLLSSMQLGVSVQPVDETGTLIVTGYAFRMARIEELLRMVDKPGKPRGFKFRQLKYTMAETLAGKVKALAEQLGTVSVAISSRADAPDPKAVKSRRSTTPVTQNASATQDAVYLDFDERTNRILIIGYEEQLALVEELVDSLDVEKQDLRTLRLYDIQYVGAEEVKEKLAELGIISEGTQQSASTTKSRSRSQSQRQAQIETAPVLSPSPSPTQTEILTEEPQVIVVDSTNSLLVNATPEQHVQVAMIIGYVDNETLEDAVPYEIYPLENQKPEDLAGVLNELIQETVEDTKDKIEKVVQRREDDIVIVPDENTFSIIVYASRKNQEWIKKLIEKLDKRRPQVLIEVSLVEIERTKDFEYDLNIIANATSLVTNNVVVKEAAGGLPYTLTGNAREGGWNLGSAGKIKGFWGDDKIQAIITAMDSKSYGRVLAKPKILVNDNEEGKINTTEKTYVGEDTQTWPSGDGQQSVTTTKYVEYPAKIELVITPHISEGDLLRLEVNMTREDFTKQEKGPPDYSTSEITTVVTVPDGSTIILGGLTKLNQTKGGSKVPILGDVPLVGSLFRSVANSDDTKKLYVFVKANILRPDDAQEGLRQLEDISNENKIAFERFEKEFQDKEDWPSIEPDPIDPIRVLEDN